MSKIKVGVAGYGNLGRGVELALSHCDDMELCAVFTRRDPKSITLLTPNVKVCHIDDAPSMRDTLDVMILCGGSATDLPVQGPGLVEYFHTIDSFDTHAKIPAYFEAMDEAAKRSGHIGLLSVGWDPGLFSLNRLYAGAILPHGRTYTFWGKGVSQGHSDAIRRIEGVRDGIQYTVPVEAAMDEVRSGSNPALTTRQKHLRECYVVAEEGADRERIEREIKTMPNYFDEYDTTVHFITEEERIAHHSAMPHGGFVIHSGKTGRELETQQTIEYSLRLGSNPEFTSSVLVAYARAVHRLAGEGARGAKTVLDIPPAYLSPKSGEELRRELL